MKEDELRLLRALLREPNSYVRQLVTNLNINEKRAAYICDKWTDKGWYDYGTGVLGGWLTEEGVQKAKEVLNN